MANDPSFRAYRERVVLVGPGFLRDGEQHAAHPDVMGLVLRSHDGGVEVWLRASDEQGDAEGHSAFIPAEQVRDLRQLHPGARPAVDWRRRNGN